MMQFNPQNPPVPNSEPTLNFLSFVALVPYAVFYLKYTDNHPNLSTLQSAVLIIVPAFLSIICLKACIIPDEAVWYRQNTQFVQGAYWPAIVISTVSLLSTFSKPDIDGWFLGLACSLTGFAILIHFVLRLEHDPGLVLSFLCFLADVIFDLTGSEYRLFSIPVLIFINWFIRFVTDKLREPIVVADGGGGGGLGDELGGVLGEELGVRAEELGGGLGEELGGVRAEELGGGGAEELGGFLAEELGGGGFDEGRGGVVSDEGGVKSG